MKPIENYADIQASTGEYETLEAGGYLLTLQSVTEETSGTGRQGVRICFDIAEGGHAGYFARQYQADTRPDRRWGGSFWQMTEGRGASFFKGFIHAVEASNPGYRWNWDERSLAGKRVGGIFRREEYRRQDGRTAWVTRLWQFRSTDAIRAGVEPPADKPLAPAGQTPYIPASYLPAPNLQPVSTDDGLPF